MSRSVRKYPARWMCADSERWDKANSSRRHRLACKRAIQRGDDLLPHYRQFGSWWNWASDGQYVWDDTAEYYERWRQLRYRLMGK